MKYSLEFKIHKPVDQVIELFDNVDNLKKWQPGLLSFEHLTGEAGKVGAKSKLLYKTGKKEFEMIETLVVKNLPEEFTGTHETRGMKTRVKNKFEKIDENSTRWIVENEFQLNGFMKLMAFIMPGAFKRQSSKFMERFISFAESEN